MSYVIVSKKMIKLFIHLLHCLGCNFPKNKALPNGASYLEQSVQQFHASQVIG